MPHARTFLAAFALAIVALGGAYALGSSRAPTQTALAPAQATVVPAATAVAPPQKTPVATPATGGMDAAAFWRLMAETRAAAGNDTGRQTELIDSRLRKLPAQQIVAFDRIHRALDRQVYTWDIWGAAYVIEDGCSDDCFRDFRAYLISLGQGPYQAALTNPDAIAPIVQDAETGNWENADNPAPDAYSSVTGQDFPGDSSDLSGNPRGTPWDDNQIEMLVRRYPRLAARFR